MNNITKQQQASLAYLKVIKVVFSLLWLGGVCANIINPVHGEVLPCFLAAAWLLVSIGDGRLSGKLKFLGKSLLLTEIVTFAGFVLTVISLTLLIRELKVDEGNELAAIGSAFGSTLYTIHVLIKTRVATQTETAPAAQSETTE